MSVAAYRTLRRCAVKSPAAAWRGAPPERYTELGFSDVPDVDRAIAEHATFVAALRSRGVDVVELPPDDRTGPDSVYACDPGLPLPDGQVTALRMGKRGRADEEHALVDAGVATMDPLPPEASAEGGDLLWLADDLLVAARSFRTNATGIAHLRSRLERHGVEVVDVHLPAWRGPDELLHLMSTLSLLDVDLAVGYRPLIPVPLIELLDERGIALIEVPDSELATQGPNVLATGPRRVIALRDNAVTNERLRAAGCDVTEVAGDEIAQKGGGGPTCLVLAIERG